MFRQHVLADISTRRINSLNVGVTNSRCVDLVQNRYLLLEFFRVERVVVTKPADVTPGRETQTMVHGSGDPCVFLINVFEIFTVGSRYIRASVGRTIVNHDEFEIPKRLLEYAFDRDP
jgi:hypothetical protein